MTKAERIAKGLSEAQRALVLASEPGGWGMRACATGTPISGQQYRSARVLHRLGVGTFSHGSPYGDLYFNTDDFGLAVREILTRATADDLRRARTTLAEVQP